METFSQILRGPVWDGDLVSKSERDRLKEAGFIDSGYGYSFVTAKGVEAAKALGLIEPISPYAKMQRALADGSLLASVREGFDPAKPGSDQTVCMEVTRRRRTCKEPGCGNWTRLSYSGYCDFHDKERGTASKASPDGY